MTGATNFKEETQARLQEGIDGIRREAREAQSEVTRRVNAFFANPLAALPPGVGTETGGAVYSSLAYPGAAAAEEAFKKHDPHVYARNGTPAATTLTDALTCFEPGAAWGQSLSHGMTAVTAVTDSLVLAGKLKAGDRVVASQFLFGTCRKVVENLRLIGVDVQLIDGRDLNAWDKAVKGDTKLVFFETPGNPTLELVDIRAAADRVHARSNALVVVDNSLEFAAQAPLSLGADIAVASLTKILGPDPATGGGADSGGVIFLSHEGLRRTKQLTGEDNAIFDHIQRRGGLIAARVATEMLERLPLLEPRFRRQSETARYLAQHIADNHPAIGVLSPHVASHPQHELFRRQMKGSVVFTLDLGGREEAFDFIDRLIDQGLPYVNNFYSYRTTLTHPASTTHHSLTGAEQLAQGLRPGHVRVSAGVEDAAYLARLFDLALSKAPALDRGACAAAARSPA